MEVRGKGTFISSSIMEEWKKKENGRYRRADAEDNKHICLGKAKFEIDWDGQDKTATEVIWCNQPKPVVSVSQRLSLEKAGTLLYCKAAHCKGPF